MAEQGGKFLSSPEGFGFCFAKQAGIYENFTDDGKTMIQLTVERISPLVDIKDVYVATNKNYRELVKQQLPGIPEENILCEPIGRNTAPCVGLGAVHVATKYDDAVMIVLPSDHLIKNNEVFADTFKEAVQIAEEGANLVTVGITPNYPETGYGYIKYNQADNKNNAYSLILSHSQLTTVLWRKQILSTHFQATSDGMM